MNKYEQISFFPADILLPKNTDMTKWSVVACDQYTSQPNYWEEVDKIVGNSPSTYNLVLPELYLNNENVEEKISEINKNMDNYILNLLKEYNDSFVYIERTLSNGKVRKGIVGAVDLEQYEFKPGNSAMIRATEGTVAERIPPRVRVRENASLELPHVMLLIDDIDNIVFDSIKKSQVIYDFELMQNSGKIKGWLVDNNSDVADALINLQKKNFENNGTMLYAVGDGNHSLATAKACWENIKKSCPGVVEHPARYALVELENIHDEALEFEPIHRIVSGCDVDDLLTELYNYCGITEEPIENAQEISSVINCEVKKLYIQKPTSNIAVGTLQGFLDDYINKNNCDIDYIHGEDVVKELSKNKNSIGFLLPSMEKSDLFATIITDGILPRKTFSMGEACDKRFYVEARRINTEEN